jgi:hypothetical protein
LSNSSGSLAAIVYRDGSICRCGVGFSGKFLVTSHESASQKKNTFPFTLISTMAALKDMKPGTKL